MGTKERDPQETAELPDREAMSLLGGVPVPGGAYMPDALAQADGTASEGTEIAQVEAARAEPGGSSSESATARS